MKKIIFSIFCCLLPSLLTAQEIITTRHIKIMHEKQVRVRFAGEQREPNIIAADLSPARLLQVELLDFSDFPLYRIPPWLKRCTNLRHLDLSHNQLSVSKLADLNKALQDMPKLDVLDLSHNPLFNSASDQSLASVWQVLIELGELDLSHTQGTAKNYGSLATLTGLAKLNLSNNQIADVSVLGLNKLHFLKELDLSHNRIRQFPVINATHLTYLNVSHNKLSEIPYVDMPSLKVWDLQGNGSVRLADDYGAGFSLENLKKLQYDSGSDYDNLSKLPEGLQKKLERIAEKQRESDCSTGRVKIGKYLDHCNGTVTDTKTGLMWKRCSEGSSGVNCKQGKVEQYKWNVAVERFKNVKYAGYTDWRLPTIDELKTLVYCSNGVKDKDRGTCNDDSVKPTINQQAFPNTLSGRYWSGSPYADNSDGAWYVYFYYGNSSIGNRGNYYAVRLVRAGQ